MKIFASLFLLVQSVFCFGQTLYDMEWTHNDIDYYGLMVFFNEDDIYMRISYDDNGEEILYHSEYYYDFELEDEGVIFMEAGETDAVTNESFNSPYEPFHIFWYENEDYTLDGPYVISDFDFQEELIDNAVEVDLIELNPDDLSPEYVSQFFTPEDEEYAFLLNIDKEPIEAIDNTLEGDARSVDITLNLILVSNTKISDIGASSTMDMNNIASEFEGIANALKIKFNKQEFKDKDFTKENVNAYITSFKPGHNDIVIFHYAGHGYRFDNQTTKYPQLDLRYDAYQESGELSSINLNEIYEALIQKGGRLNIVLGDCCNNSIGVLKEMGSDFLGARSSVNASNAKLVQLFCKSSGNIIASGAKEGQKSYGNSSIGGWFTSSFINALREEVSKLRTEDQPDWQGILSQTSNSTLKKSKMCRKCNDQNIIYDETIR